MITKPIQKQDIKILFNIDKKITEIESQIHLLSVLKPLNLREEQETFFNKPNFSPQFIYKLPKADFSLLLKDLEKIPKQVDHPLFSLYKAKIKEIKYKIQLIQNLNNKKFTYFSEKLFGAADKSLYRQARTFIKKIKIQPDESPLLKHKESLEIIEKFLKKHHLSHWKIKILENAATDMQVNKNNILFIKKNAQFTKNRLKALIAHEIQTHIYRFENGKLQPFLLLARGTANYLLTEEGLAIYNQNSLGINLGEKYIWPALSVIAAYHSNQMSFLDLFHYLTKTFNLSNQIAWKLCLKSKRGLCDTAKHLTFTKDIIYFKGEKKIQKYLKQSSHKLADLYIGKISVDDVDTLKNFQQFKVKYLPDLKDQENSF